MDQKLNYGYIMFGGKIITEGKVDDWRYSNSCDAVVVIIDGIKYETASVNVLLMHKDLDE